MLFFIFLIIHLYILIAPVILQIFNPIAELAIPIGIPIGVSIPIEAKAEMEGHPVIVEPKTRICSI